MAKRKTRKALAWHRAGASSITKVLAGRKIARKMKRDSKGRFTGKKR